MQLIDARVCAVGIAVGETVLTPEEFSARYQGELEAVVRTMGDKKIFVSETVQATELAARAARICLERSRVAAEQLDVILWCGRQPDETEFPSLRVQHEIGARKAFALDIGQGCADLVGAMQVACGLFASDQGIEHVLVACGAVWEKRLPYRSSQPVVVANNNPIYSDGAGAMLITRGRGLRVLGFGAASEGSLWDRLRQLEAGEVAPDSPSTLAIMRASVEMHLLALERCLKQAGAKPEDVDQIVLQVEGNPRIPLSYARGLKLDPAKVVETAGAPTHTGASDALFVLDRLSNGATLPDGKTILVGGRTIGLMRFALLGPTTT